MSDAGSDPRDQPDGSFYNPFPGNSPPGLLGGQYATRANDGMDWLNPGPTVDASGDGTGLSPSLTLPQQSAPTAPQGSSPFNLYDWLHAYLNTQPGSRNLQFAQDLIRSFERTGNQAALVGAGGVVAGAATLDPFVAAGSGLLAGLGAGMNGAGKLGDLATSFLKSVQQDNDRPSLMAVPRAGESGFSDLEIPDS